MCFECQNVLIAPGKLVQAHADGAEKIERAVEASRNVARMQGCEPAHGLQVAQATGRVLHVGFEVINRVLKFRPTLESESCELPRHGRAALVNESVEFLVETMEQRRVARNAVSEEVVRIQQDPTKTIDDVRHLVAGVRGRTNVMGAGDTDGGIWTVGQSQGLIHDIPTCAELVRNIMDQAEAVLEKNARRMAAMA